MIQLSLWPFAAALLALGSPAASAGTPVVHIAQGDLSGTLDHGARAWLGIPFAAPPVGDLRWKPPVAAPSWNGTRKADRFAASCQQAVDPKGLGPWTHEYVVSGPVSEDCLYLNIWAPAKAVKKRPVLVWIHGGAFTSGSGSVPIYDGAALAAKGIVVVNMNYRLGVYGFFAHPGLDKENPAGASGNYGLMDQIAALKWVRANIAAFGGDPDNVTLAGQSAGAASVHELIASPMAQGLFVRAIAESGSGMGLQVADHAAAKAAGLRFAADKTSATQARDTLARDRGLASMYLWAAHREATSRAPIYAYLWTHIEPGPDSARYKAFHSSEMPYVFGTLDTSNRPFTAADRKLSRQAQSYWLNFIRDGDPNGPGLPRWPRLTPSDKLILNIGDDTHVQPVLAPAKLEAFTRHVRDGGALGLFAP